MHLGSRVERLPVYIVPGPSLLDLRTIKEFAERHQLTAYDAECLRVAKDLKLAALATQDKSLIAAAKREKVPIITV